MDKKRVMVFMGGNSEEREVSLRSGAAILKALQNRGYEVQGLDFQTKDLAAAEAQLLSFKPDIVFIGLHGRFGEDGAVQGLLEMMNIPYTGSGIACSAICMDKALTKRFIQAGGFSTPDYRLLHAGILKQPEALEKVLEEALGCWGMPIVVKAAGQGSSIGTFIVREKGELKKAVEQCFAFDDRVILERFIDGREITVPLIGNQHPRVLPLIEVSSKNTFFDYEAKYTSGMCEHIIPAPIGREALKEIIQLSVEVYRFLDCRAYARIDFMLDQQGKAWILELNTLPGMTDMSLVPDSARAAGISFEDLLEKILEYSMENFYTKN